MDLEHFIACPRFGGRRPAPACMHYDRYRLCRKKCKSLEAFIKKNPSSPELVKAIQAKETAETRYEQPSLFLPTKFSGKNLPDFALQCRLCVFVGKTERGLKIHLKRKHRVTLLK